MRAFPQVLVPHGISLTTETAIKLIPVSGGGRLYGSLGKSQSRCIIHLRLVRVKKKKKEIQIEETARNKIKFHKSPITQTVEHT